MSQAAKKIQATSIPQANNIFRLKMLIEKANHHGVVTQDQLASLFADSRDRAYYVSAAQNTLGWVKTSKKGNLHLTEKARALMGANDVTFSAAVHADLAANDTWYNAVVQAPTHIDPVITQLATAMNLSSATASRRVATYIKWFMDLEAGMNNDTTKVQAAKRAALISNAVTATGAVAYSNMAAITCPTSLVTSLYRDAQVTQRTFQTYFKNGLAVVQGGRCAITGLAMMSLLKASHIKPCSACIGQEAIDLFNGLLLTPTFDHLFDRGLITFTNDGTMRVSKSMDDATRAQLQLDTYTKLMFTPPQGMHKYLAYHRRNVFQA